MKLVCALALLLWTLPLSAQSRWVNIADPDTEPILMDTVTASHTGDVHKVWIKYVLPRTKTRPATKNRPAFKYKSWMTQFEVDCISRKLKDGETLYYDPNSELVYSSPATGYEQFEGPPPETIGEAVVVAVCARFR